MKTTSYFAAEIILSDCEIGEHMCKPRNESIEFGFEQFCKQVCNKIENVLTYEYRKREDICRPSVSAVLTTLASNSSIVYNHLFDVYTIQLNNERNQTNICSELACLNDYN